MIYVYQPHSTEIEAKLETKHKHYGKFLEAEEGVL